MRQLTVIGGGIGGLVAATEAAEAGWQVHLHEAKPTLGGRGGSAPGEFTPNWGPHALYCRGPFGRWLAARDLLRPYHRAPLRATVRFRHGDAGHRRPPKGLLGALLRIRRATDAPVDADFTTWASSLVGDDRARLLATSMGVVTFDHDPGRWSAAFVQGQLRRATRIPPDASYPVGAWQAVIDRMAAHARARGVTIETGSRVDALPNGPVVVATTLRAARELLGDNTLTWHGTRTALLDVGVQRRRPDPFVTIDHDESGWAEMFSRPDPSLAPPGHDLVQVQKGMRPGESLDDAVRRCEVLLDAGYPGWRDREVWRRRLRIEDQTGALDPVGATWRDRPAIDRGDGVFVATDMSAAPGLLAEVTVNAAVTASHRLFEAHHTFAA